MNDTERIATIEHIVAEQQAQIATHKTEVGLLRAAMDGIQNLPAMNQDRANRMLPLYALLATRVRAIEEKVFTPEEAATIHRYWIQALSKLGINVDPLNLERNA